MHGPRKGWTQRRAFHIPSVRRDLDEELAFHFVETVEELMAGGMSREQAEAEARRRFGDESRYRWQLAATDRGTEARRRRGDWLGGAAQTARYAVRNVVRTRGLSAAIVLLLALGIGANATMFSTIDRLLLSAPEHIRDPEQVKRIWVERWMRSAGERRVGRVSYLDYVDLSEASNLPGVAGYTSAGEILGVGLDARMVFGWAVTGSFWEILGVRPQLGRFFNEEDDDPDGEPVVVLSYELWRSDFGGDASVIGRRVRIGAMVYTVLGVAPRGFTGVELVRAGLWLPFHQRFHRVYAPYMGGQVLGRDAQLVNLVTRLAHDVSPQRVAEAAEATYLAGRRDLVERGAEDEDQRITLASLNGPNRGLFNLLQSADQARDAAVAKWLGGVSLLLLLIACANVANLLLARSIRQRRETAIRLALGVSRRRLIAQTMVEGLLLAGLGGAVALALIHWGGWLMQRTLLPGVAWDAPLTARLLAFVLAATASVGLLSALGAAFQASRYAVGGVLGAISGGSAPAAARLRSWLVMTQAAVSVVLLVGAGLFLRSLGAAQAIDVGYDASRILGIEPWFISESDLSDRLSFAERARERLASLPGVVAAAWGGDGTPFAGGSAPRLRATGNDSVSVPGGGGPYRFRVTPDYFRVLGLEIVEGRGFEATDVEGSEPVAVVSRSLARHLWPSEASLGKCLFVGASEACSRIVGVVADARLRTIGESATFAYFLPFGQTSVVPPVLVVRTRDEPGPMVDAIKRELTAMDDRVRYVTTLNIQGDLIDRQLLSWKLGATLFSAFGLLAVVVATIGLYSVLSFDVEQRRREIGLRTALGASRDGVVRLFVTRAVKLAALGTAVGLTFALALAPWIQDLLFQTSAMDPLVFGGIALVLISVGVCAGALPAWRAASVDPNVVLREE